jgi:hypothetical protein
MKQILLVLMSAFSPPELKVDWVQFPATLIYHIYFASR